MRAHALLDGSALQLQLTRLAGRVEPGRGRFGDLTLELPAQGLTIALPGSAIYGTHRVFKVVDQRLHPVTVERVGSLSRDGESLLFLVRSEDLRAGDPILSTQLANAIDGLRVQIAQPRPKD